MDAPESESRRLARQLSELRRKSAEAERKRKAGRTTEFNKMMKEFGINLADEEEEKGEREVEDETKEELPKILPEISEQKRLDQELAELQQQLAIATRKAKKGRTPEIERLMEINRQRVIEDEEKAEKKRKRKVAKKAEKKRKKKKRKVRTEARKRAQKPDDESSSSSTTTKTRPSTSTTSSTTTTKSKGEGPLVVKGTKISDFAVLIIKRYIRATRFGLKDDDSDLVVEGVSTIVALTALLTDLMCSKVDRGDTEKEVINFFDLVLESVIMDKTDDLEDPRPYAEIIRVLEPRLIPKIKQIYAKLKPAAEAKRKAQQEAQMDERDKDQADWDVEKKAQIASESFIANIVVFSDHTRDVIKQYILSAPNGDNDAKKILATAAMTKVLITLIRGGIHDGHNRKEEIKKLLSLIVTHTAKSILERGNRCEQSHMYIYYKLKDMAKSKAKNIKTIVDYVIPNINITITALYYGLPQIMEANLTEKVLGLSTAEVKRVLDASERKHGLTWPTSNTEGNRMRAIIADREKGTEPILSKDQRYHALKRYRNIMYEMESYETDLYYWRNTIDFLRVIIADILDGQNAGLKQQAVLKQIIWKLKPLLDYLPTNIKRAHVKRRVKDLVEIYFPNHKRQLKVYGPIYYQAIYRKASFGKIEAEEKSDDSDDSIDLDAPPSFMIPEKPEDDSDSFDLNKSPFIPPPLSIPKNKNRGSSKQQQTLTRSLGLSPRKVIRESANIDLIRNKVIPLDIQPILVEYLNYILAEDEDDPMPDKVSDSAEKIFEWFILSGEKKEYSDEVIMKKILHIIDMVLQSGKTYAEELDPIDDAEEIARVRRVVYAKINILLGISDEEEEEEDPNESVRVPAMSWTVYPLNEPQKKKKSKEEKQKSKEEKEKLRRRSLKSAANIDEPINIYTSPYSVVNAVGNYLTMLPPAGLDDSQLKGFVKFLDYLINDGLQKGYTKREIKKKIRHMIREYMITQRGLDPAIESYAVGLRGVRKIVKAQLDDLFKKKDTDVIMIGDKVTQLRSKLRQLALNTSATN